MLSQPKFWKTRNIISSILVPLSFIFRILTFIKKIQKPKELDIPIICVGNLTIGGEGKTPTVLSLTKILKKNGRKIAVILRGYGGKLNGPIKVNLNHSTHEVGDEAKLHSKHNDTWISKDRYNAAKIILDQKRYDYIFLDDGLQNNSLKYDFKICVIDSSEGLGNKRVFPSGPLREDLKFGINKIDYAVIIGPKNINLEKLILGLSPKLKFIYGNFLELQTKNVLPKSRNIIAFAGIGFPDKFFRFLEKINIKVIKKIIFADHYIYSNSDINKLLKLANDKNAVLLTTSKDYIKLIELTSYQKIKNILFEMQVELILNNHFEIISLIKTIGNQKNEIKKNY